MLSFLLTTVIGIGAMLFIALILLLPTFSVTKVVKKHIDVSTLTES